MLSHIYMLISFSRIRFLENLFIKQLSQKICVDSNHLNWSLLRIFLSQSTWHAQEATTTNIASIIDKVTIVCFLNDHEIAVELI